jgi:hypothetical protein
MADLSEDIGIDGSEIGPAGGEVYTSDDEYDYDYETDSNFDLDAQQQWEESITQIEGLFSMLLFPLIGKALGRKFSHRIWRNIADWWYINQ